MQHDDNRDRAEVFRGCPPLEARLPVRCTHWRSRVACTGRTEMWRSVRVLPKEQGKRWLCFGTGVTDSEPKLEQLEDAVQVRRVQLSHKETQRCHR